MRTAAIPAQQQGGIPRRGSVLILALWTLVFLTTLATGSSSMVRQDIRTTEKLEWRSELYDIAASGAVMVTGIFTKPLQDDPFPSIDTLNDPWADGLSSCRQVRLGEGSFSLLYGAVDNMTGRRKEYCGIIDEDRKINLNTAPQKVLENLFVKVGGVQDADEARSLAQAVIDWRDPDNSAGDGTGAMSEAQEYAALGYRYGPANRPFDAPEEMLLVRGFTAPLFFAVRDIVTSYGSGRININTAPRQALRCLDLSDALVDKIIFYRAGPDGVEGTDDDNVFKAAGSLGANLAAYCDVTSQEELMMANLMASNFADIRSDAFTVTSIARRADGRGGYCKVVCVFTKRGGIRYWGVQHGAVGAE